MPDKALVDIVEKAIQRGSGWGKVGNTVSFKSIPGRSVTVEYNDDLEKVVFNGVAAKVRFPYDMVMKFADNPVGFAKVLREARLEIFGTKEEQVKNFDDNNGNSLAQNKMPQDLETSDGR